MSVMAFDTLKTAKSLEAAGFTPAQAEAVASTFGTAFTETAATKGDVDKLGSELRGEMATMEARLGSADASTRSRRGSTRSSG